MHGIGTHRQRRPSRGPLCAGPVSGGAASAPVRVTPLHPLGSPATAQSHLHFIVRVTTGHRQAEWGARGGRGFRAGTTRQVWPPACALKCLAIESEVIVENMLGL